MFRRVVPFSKLVILGSGPFISTLHNLAEYQERCRREMGIEIELIPVGHSVEEALNSIPADAEAVSVAPILHLESASFQQLANGLIQKKLPSFAVMGRVQVERGLMVGLLPESFFPKNARTTALNIQRILLGEKAEELPVVLPINERLVINMSTARAIGKFPDWSVITEAELINEQARAVEWQVDLRSVVAKALSVNLELLAKKFETEAGKENRRQAIANLLPQIAVSALGAIIDKELAGIVINNAIVLIDRIEIEIKNGLEPSRAIIESAQRRLRPILLTTTTTVGGLLPLWFSGGEMWKPMAISIIFGLSFATVLTLGLVPVLYSLFYYVSFKEFKY